MKPLDRQNERIRKVLYVSNAFPPSGGAGVQRTVKFVKYLGEFGFEPTVITPARPATAAIDASLGGDIPDTVRILRTATLEPSYEVKSAIMKDRGCSRLRKIAERIARALLIPDPQVLWIPGLVAGAVRARRDAFDLIFVTAPPFSALMAGVLIKRILGVPLVCDFRDEWVGWLDGSSWGEIGTKKRWSSRIERLMEKTVIRQSDAVIAASEGYVAAFRRKYRSHSGKFFCVTNGFDPSDLATDDCDVASKTFRNGTPLEIVYMGTVWSATSLRYFLEGLRACAQRYRVKVTVIGRISPEEQGSLASFQNDLNVTAIGYRPHHEALSIASRAGVALLTLTPLPGAERIIPGKVFEYMGMGKRILGVLPEGSASTILSDYEGAIVVDPADTNGIAESIALLVREWDSEGTKRQWSCRRDHTRMTKTKELCSIFNRVLSAGQ